MNLLKFVFTDPAYPTKWEEGKGLEYKKNYKWRLAAPNHNNEIPFYDNRFLALDINSFHFREFISSLANEPYDPLIRWILFILEYGLSEEALMEEAQKKFIDNVNDRETWGDISLTHLLTYDKKRDEYTYEIKEFNRLIEGFDMLKVAEYTLEQDKKDYYFTKFLNMKTHVMSKNKDIVQESENIAINNDSLNLDKEFFNEYELLMKKHGRRIEAQLGFGTNGEIVVGLVVKSFIETNKTGN